jgi:polyisoprenyl-teichoic acid--peptidoglycan teichoic acid transferase
MPRRVSAPQQPKVPTPALLARQLPIDMELPDHAGPSLIERRRKWQKARRMATRSTAIAMVMLITLGGLLFSQSYLKVNKVFKGSAGTAAALNQNVKPELLKGEGRGRVNILLLGRGGGNHDAPDLTDTIMVASIDPINRTTTLLSLPRDFWVNVPDQGVMKVNAAWQSGHYSYLGKRASSNDTKAVQAGFKTIDATIKDVLDIEIDYHVLVNFQAFKQAVDSVGGVNINVPTDLIDPTMAWENANNPLLAKAGLQSFDGHKALIYARSRETSSDFARGERQRALLLALKTKVVSVGTLSNPVKISKLVNAFGNNVQTDLSVNNANRLYGIMKGVKDTSVTSIGLADPANPLVTTGNMNGQSVVLPKSGLYKYAEIQNFLRSQLRDPYIMKEKAKVLVLNGTNIPGMASAKAEELKAYGYNVMGAQNAPSSGWTRTTLVDMTRKHKYTKNYLEQRFGQHASNTIGDTTIPTNGADFVIILGSDEVASQ